MCDTGLVRLRGCMSVSKVKTSLLWSELTRPKSTTPPPATHRSGHSHPGAPVCACMKGAVQSASKINSTSCQLPPVWSVDATANCWTRCLEPKHCTTQILNPPGETSSYGLENPSVHPKWLFAKKILKCIFYTREKHVFSGFGFVSLLVKFLSSSSVIIIHPPSI